MWSLLANELFLQAVFCFFSLKDLVTVRQGAVGGAQGSLDPTHPELAADVLCTALTHRGGLAAQPLLPGSQWE